MKYSIGIATHIGLVAVLVCGTVTSGRLAAADSPGTVGAVEFIELFEKLGGVHPGHRRAHARGVCAAGRFLPEQSGVFAGADLLEAGELPVAIRFSVGGGSPEADERTPGTRGVGLRLQLPNGAYHVFTGNNFPVFAGKDPATFFGFLETLLPDASGKTDPARVARYVKEHPSVQANAAWRRSARTAASYANTEFFGLHTFHYAGKADAITRFRWHLVPDLGVSVLEPTEAATRPDNFLADTLAAQLGEEEVSFTLEAVIGEDGDTDIDPSQQWPTDRSRVTLGKVIVTRSGGDDCRDINFDPNLLSTGFQPSDDPVLRLRSAAYAISFSKRVSGK